jgi:uncharacterized protein (DUF433 family)
MSNLVVSNISDGTTTETWKPILGYEDAGYVSDAGRMIGKSGKFRKTYMGNSGYERVAIYSRGKRINASMHRLIAMTFCDGYEDGLVVNHKDGNKLNNCASNLEWVTVSENSKHSFDVLGRQPTRRWLRIPDAEIGKIIRRRENGETYKSIAADYGVRQEAIRNRLKRASWNKWESIHVNA